MSNKPTKAEITQALEELRRTYPAGATVYTITREISRTGGTRLISVLAFRDGLPLWPNWKVAAVTGRPYVAGGAHDAIRCRGYGTNHAAEIVDHLSRVLYGKPYGSEGALRLEEL